MKKVGLDLVDISRFKRFTVRKEHNFLRKVFSEKELNYCFEYKEPACHLAGIFAAKEAVSKALGTKGYPSIGLEIRYDRSGAPQVWKNGRKLSICVSITHTSTVAAAVAIG